MNIEFMSVFVRQDTLLRNTEYLKQLKIDLFYITIGERVAALLPDFQKANH